MTVSLTNKQRRFFRIFCELHDAHGRSPTYAALTAATGLGSRGHVSDYVKRLCASGHLAWRNDPYGRRSLVIVQRAVPPTIQITPAGYRAMRAYEEARARAS